MSTIQKDHELSEDPAEDIDQSDDTEPSEKEYSLDTYKELEIRPDNILSFEINVSGTFNMFEIC